LSIYCILDFGRVESAIFGEFDLKSDSFSENRKIVRKAKTFCMKKQKKPQIEYGFAGEDFCFAGKTLEMQHTFVPRYGKICK